LDALGQSTSLM